MLFETIFKRRQVRRFGRQPLSNQVLGEIAACVSQSDQLAGTCARFSIASAEEVSGGVSAPHYLLGYCDDSSAAYANVGYVLQKADLYIQSMGLGSGWFFLGPRPKKNRSGFCIALAFGPTEVPMRTGPHDFRRLPVERISPVDNTVTQAVRLAPSSVNSQPWILEFAEGKVILKEQGRGIARVVLRNKLNKIDLGIAARHAVLALLHEGKEVKNVVATESDQEFRVEIAYK